MVNPAIQSELGRVSRGWRRWVRARDAAFAKPHTVHGRLYFARLRLVENLDWDTVVLYRATRYGSGYTKDATDYWTCSEVCFGLQTTLNANLGFGDETVLRRTIERRWTVAQKLSHEFLNRSITCHVCRRKVNKDGTVDNTYRIDFRDPNQEIKDVPKRTGTKTYRGTPAVETTPAPVSARRVQQFFSLSTRWSDGIGGSSDELTRREYDVLRATLNALRTN
jgi:hypothetical protein